MARILIPVSGSLAVPLLIAHSYAQEPSKGLDDTASAPSASEFVTPEQSGIGVFSELEWRGFAMAGHISHGPAFAAGITAWEGKLRLGLGGFARPGPINPTTFEVEPVDGQSYRGQDRLKLRSDGALIGAHAALVFHAPGIEALAISIPVTVGQAAFGFYLTGEDRQTPDGRRVSEWENQLFDGRDSGVGLGVDAGLRLCWKATPWLRPYVSGNLFTTFGFESFVSSNYSGPSVGLGIELGAGL